MDQPTVDSEGARRGRLWLWLLSVSCLNFQSTSTALQLHFHGPSTALPRHFHGPSSALPWKEIYIYIYTFNNIGDSIRFGREFKCLPYADLLLIIFKLSSYAFEETVHILQMNGLIGCVPVLDRLLTFYFPHKIQLNEDFLCYTISTMQY